MNRDNEEYAGIERLLKRAHPPEPSCELKARVLGTARAAWPNASTAVPWQIPFRRLVVSATAATVLISLANLYGDHASAHRPVAPTPVAERIEPCDLDVMTDPDASFIRYTVTTAGSVRPDAPTLFDHLERVREALRETERDETADSPAPIEQRSRLPWIPSSLNS